MSAYGFTVSEDHLKLLRAAYIGWDDCEFGAPAIDCKRPYGNSSVHLDMAEILGLDGEVDDDGEMPSELRARLTQLHQETQTVLQIILRTGRMEAGTYVKSSRWSVDWHRVETA